MKKTLLSLLLSIAMACSFIPSAAAASSEAALAADTLYELGLFKGTGTNADGTPIFDLNKTPTRNQAIIMLVRLLGKEEMALSGTWDIPFTDVPENMRPYIGYAYANGLTNGTSATTYSGTNPIRANQYITFVLRALGYVSGEDFEVSTAWNFSDEIGLTTGQYNGKTTSFIRGDVAVISSNALSVQLKTSNKSLAEKLISDGVFTSAEYKKASESPVILKEPPAPTGPDVTFAVDGKLMPDWDWDYRASAGTYIVTPYRDGKPFDAYEVEIETGKGSVTKNGDGTFTVNYPATETTSIALWYNFVEFETVDENGEKSTSIGRTKRSFSFAPPVSVPGFALDRKGATILPGETYGNNFSRYFVMDVYYNGTRLDEYTVTSASGAPFTASIQADGSLLLMKTGSGRGAFTISYLGKSATFALFTP